MPGTVKRQRSKYNQRLTKVKIRPKFSNFTAMDDARSWSELLSAIISHFGTSILWHIGMTRQCDVQWDTTRQNQQSTGKFICKRNTFYSETSQIACGLPVEKLLLEGFTNKRFIVRFSECELAIQKITTPKPRDTLQVLETRHFRDSAPGTRHSVLGTRHFRSNRYTVCLLKYRFLISK